MTNVATIVFERGRWRERDKGRERQGERPEKERPERERPEREREDKVNQRTCINMNTCDSYLYIYQ